jgi:hypothetical protein
MRLFPHRYAQDDLLIDSIKEAMFEDEISWSLSESARDVAGKHVRVSRGSLNKMLIQLGVELAGFSPYISKPPRKEIWFRVCSSIRRNETGEAMGKLRKAIPMITAALNNMSYVSTVRNDDPILSEGNQAYTTFFVTMDLPTVFVEGA